MYEQEIPYMSRDEAFAQVEENPKGILETVYYQQEALVKRLKIIIERQRDDVAYECDQMLDELVDFEEETTVKESCFVGFMSKGE